MQYGRAVTTGTIGLGRLIVSGRGETFATCHNNCLHHWPRRFYLERLGGETEKSDNAIRLRASVALSLNYTSEPWLVKEGQCAATAIGFDHLEYGPAPVE